MNIDGTEDWTQEFERAISGAAASPEAERLARGFRALAPSVPDELVDLAKAIMPAKERTQLRVSLSSLGQAWAGARGSDTGHLLIDVGDSTLRLSYEDTEDGFLVQGRIGTGPWFLDTADGPIEIEPGTTFEQVVDPSQPMRFWNSTDEFEVPPLGTMRPEGA